MDNFQHPDLPMKFQTGVYVVLAFIAAMVSCKSRPIEKAGSENRANSGPASRRALPEPPIFDDGVATEERLEIGDRNNPSFDKLDEELMAELALIPPPKNREEDNVISGLYRQTLQRKKLLLFSVPVTQQARRDFEEAWEILEIPDASGFFNDSQVQYSKDMISKYSDAPLLERLMIWKLIKLRIESTGKRGSGAAEESLRFELARFLMLSLGIDRRELFEAVHPRTRYRDREASVKGKWAEEEITRIYNEQSERAQRIFESQAGRSLREGQ